MNRVKSSTSLSSTTSDSNGCSSDSSGAGDSQPVNFCKYKLMAVANDRAQSDPLEDVFAKEEKERGVDWPAYHCFDFYFDDEAFSSYAAVGLESGRAEDVFCYVDAKLASKTESEQVIYDIFKEASSHGTEPTTLNKIVRAFANNDDALSVDKVYTYRVARACVDSVASAFLARTGHPVDSHITNHPLLAPGQKRILTTLLSNMDESTGAERIFDIIAIDKMLMAASDDIQQVLKIFETDPGDHEYAYDRVKKHIKDIDASTHGSIRKYLCDHWLSDHQEMILRSLIDLGKEHGLSAIADMYDGRQLSDETRQFIRLMGESGTLLCINNNSYSSKYQLRFKSQGKEYVHNFGIFNQGRAVHQLPADYSDLEITYKQGAATYYNDDVVYRLGDHLDGNLIIYTGSKAPRTVFKNKSVENTRDSYRQLADTINHRSPALTSYNGGAANHELSGVYNKLAQLARDNCDLWDNHLVIHHVLDSRGVMPNTDNVFGSDTSVIGRAQNSAKKY